MHGRNIEAICKDFQALPRATTTCRLWPNSGSKVATQMHLIPDLILSTLDVLSGDTQTLLQCSLINKQWLHLARYKLFNNLTINLCVRPTDHRLCHQCITHFVDLLASRHCTIPRVINTLRLNGDVTENNWSGLWSLVGNPGGMQRSEIIWAVTKHFQSVEQLEMIKLHWFDPSILSSRVVSSFLSSVKSLTLREVGFYGGSRGLFWMLDQMRNLEVLSVNEPTWPAQSGFPNNPSALLVFSMNAAPICPFVFVPLYHVLNYASRVVEMTKPSENRYALRNPLRKLSVLLVDEEVNQWLPWLSAQKQMLRSVDTFVVSTTITTCESEVLILQDLLDSMESLLHVGIYLDGYTRDNAPASSPTLVKHRVLESLEIRLSTLSNRLLPFIPWLKNILHTATSLHLSVIRIAVTMGSSDGLNIINAMADIDSYANNLPSLRQLWIFISLRHYWPPSVESGRQRVEELEGLVRTTFKQCDAKGILRVKATSSGAPSFSTELSELWAKP